MHCIPLKKMQKYKILILKVQKCHSALIFIFDDISSVGLMTIIDSPKKKNWCVS